jgi:site-specific DNA recombinase
MSYSFSRKELIKLERVCIYLRKSRADEEAERASKEDQKSPGESETLAKHKKALFKFAKEKNLNIINLYEEVVSGESIIHRPKMLELLKDVNLGLYDAVLVMDMQRLGRGDMQDQGLILKTFKESKTKIITLQKTYDLSNDFDEEYSEFEAFMSRKELKMINRRMQGGRIRSVEDGNYIATNPPYGYSIQETKKSRSLTPDSEQAPVVKMIFDMYVTKHMGCGVIASELNSMGFKTQTGKSWYSSAISNIIKNSTYIGKITWKKKEIKKSTDPSKKTDARTRDKSEWIIVEGKHQAIIDEELFYDAQKIINEKYHIPYQLVNGARNPLAGIVICGICNSKMVLRPYGNKSPHIMCTRKCGNKSSKFTYVEEKVINYLKKFISDCELDLASNPKKQNTNLKLYNKQLELLSKELDTQNNQKLKLHDLLEQGVYDINTFLERSNIISERVEAIKENMNSINEKVRTANEEEDLSTKIEFLKDLIRLYQQTNDISEKNKLLKKAIDKVEYLKSKDAKEDNFRIKLTPRM